MVALFALGGCGVDIDPPVQMNTPLKGPAAVLFNIDGSMRQFSNPADVFPSLSVSQHRLETLLAKAAGDLQVQEVVIHFGSTSLSFARAGELAQSIRQVAVRGKPVTCHIDEADNTTYWIAATACPRILVSPAGGVEVLGLSLEAVFLRELLASLGVQADLLHIGKYKDAAEPLTRDDMSKEAREAARSLLFELHRISVEGIAAARRLEKGAVQGLIDNGPYDANDTVKLGLADGVSTLGAHLDTLRAKYVGGVIDDYGKAPAQPFSFSEVMKMFSNEAGKASSPTYPRIALVPAIGPITSGTGNEIFMGDDTIYDMELVEALSELAHDDTVKAVVLRIDSPGGSALASDNIWHAVRALAAVKPVIASMGDVAASGGYYIASAATEVFASPSTITGSIGVVGGKVVLADAAAKFGIKTERIETGKRASLTSPFTPFNDDERQVITKLMQRAYDLFVDRVVTGRKLDRDKVLAAAEGRVWTGSQALKLGLVDQNGGLAAALERAQTVAGLAPGTPVDVFPKPKNLMEMLSEALAEPEAVSLRALARRHHSVRQAITLTTLLLDHQVLTFMPAFFEIH